MIPLPGFLAPYKLLLIAAAFAVTFAAGGAAAWKLQGWRYGAQIEAMKSEAATALNAAIEAARLKEKEYEKHADAVESRYLAATAEVRKLASANRRLAAELGGLRDPYAGTSCVPGNSATSGGPPGSAGGEAGAVPEGRRGLLSPQASEFILGRAELADEITAYAWACHEWVNGLDRKGRADE